MANVAATKNVLTCRPMRSMRYATPVSLFLTSLACRLTQSVALWHAFHLTSIHRIYRPLYASFHHLYGDPYHHLLASGGGVASIT